MDLQNTNKLRPRAIETGFLGYVVNQKGYILLDLARRVIFFSHDVTFRVNIYPFKTRGHLVSDSPVVRVGVDAAQNVFDYHMVDDVPQVEVSTS